MTGFLSYYSAMSVIKAYLLVCCNISSYVLFAEDNNYLNNFRFINPKNGLCFEDIPEEIYTLELPKVPAMNDGTAGWDWMQFLRARRKEEF